MAMKWLKIQPGGTLPGWFDIPVSEACWMFTDEGLRLTIKCPRCQHSCVTTHEALNTGQGGLPLLPWMAMGADDVPLFAVEEPTSGELTSRGSITSIKTR
jgi:hypothetical protein